MHDELIGKNLEVRLSRKFQLENKAKHMASTFIKD